MKNNDKNIIEVETPVETVDEVEEVREVKEVKNPNEVDVDDLTLARLASMLLGISYPGDEFFIEGANPFTNVVREEPRFEEPAPVAPIHEEPVQEKVEVVEEKVEEPAPAKLSPSEIVAKLVKENDGSLLTRDQFADHIGTFLGIFETYNGLANSLFMKYGAKTVATIQDFPEGYKATMRLDNELGRELINAFPSVSFAKFPRSPMWFDFTNQTPANVLLFAAKESYGFCVRDAEELAEKKRIEYEENLENDDTHASVTKLLKYARSRQMVEIDVNAETKSANVKFNDKVIAIVSGNNLNFKLNILSDESLVEEYKKFGLVGERAKFPLNSKWYNFAIKGEALRKNVERIFDDAYTLARKDSMDKSKK